MTIFRRTSRLAAGLGIATAGALLLAGPAAADTSQAQATAARVLLGGNPLVTTGVVTATHAGPGGPGEQRTGTTSLAVLPGQTLLTAGALVQEARALNLNDAGGNIGFSFACAGALGGAAAIIEIGANGDCNAVNTAPGGVTLNLTPGVATLAADAIYAECTANSKGLPTGSSTLVNLNLGLLGLTPINIPIVSNGTVNQDPLAGLPLATLTALNLAGIASIRLNEQVFAPGPAATPGGQITVRALHITLLNGAADIVVGQVICGPNAIAPDVSLFGGPALPAAAAGAGAVGIAYAIRRRRQAA